MDHAIPNSKVTTFRFEHAEGKVGQLLTILEGFGSISTRPWNEAGEVPMAFVVTLTHDEDINTIVTALKKNAGGVDVTIEPETV